MAAENGPHTRIEVAAGIVWQGERILCCRRPEGRPLAGCWEFPGGKLEQGESPERALVRELDEELGIRAKRFHLYKRLEHDYSEQGFSVTLHVFHVTAHEGIPEARDGQEFCWIAWEKARELPFLPADLELVAHLAPPREDLP